MLGQIVAARNKRSSKLLLSELGGQGNWCVITIDLHVSDPPSDLIMTNFISTPFEVSVVPAQCSSVDL